MGEVVINTRLFSKDFELSPKWISSLQLNSTQRELLTNSIDPESGLITTKTLTKNGFSCEYRKSLGQISIESPVSSKKKLIHNVSDELSKKSIRII